MCRPTSLTLPSQRQPCLPAFSRISHLARPVTVTLPSKDLQDLSSCHHSHAGTQAITFFLLIMENEWTLQKLLAILPASSPRLCAAAPMASQPSLHLAWPPCLSWAPLGVAFTPLPPSWHLLSLTHEAPSPQETMSSLRAGPSVTLFRVSLKCSAGLALGPACGHPAMSLLQPRAQHSPGCTYCVERQGYQPATSSVCFHYKYHLFSVTLSG